MAAYSIVLSQLGSRHWRSFCFKVDSRFKTSSFKGRKSIVDYMWYMRYNAWSLYGDSV